MRADDERHGTTRGYHAGCRDTCCRRAIARYEKAGRLARLTGGRAVPAIGSQRRLQALAVLGWTSEDIRLEAGWGHRNGVLRILNGQKGIPCTWLEADTAATVRAVYDRLSMRTPPMNRYRRRRITTALAQGWAPPLAWDNIDDPDERPTIGAPDAVAANGGRSIANLLEDAEWLADSDATLTEVIERLDVRLDTFRDTCARAGRSDLYWRLARREPDGEQRWETSQGIKRRKEVA